MIESSVEIGMPFAKDWSYDCSSLIVLLIVWKNRARSSRVDILIIFTRTSYLRKVVLKETNTK
jgi:hypothetical protein